MSDISPLEFNSLGLSTSILQALNAVGYETPSPIQAQTIPLLLEGRDVIGQAQTGTGKTAAFALPILSRLEKGDTGVRALVLTPTRELAIQVSEAFQRYASLLKGFHVVPLYGGGDYRTQLQGLRRGAQVVVGTPGRVMDHLRRKSLSLEGLTTLVLDEADEMLRMGFIDDVEWILEQTPAEKQVALFSATMPAPIRKIAQQHLQNPAEVSIANKTVSAETIRQRYWAVRGINKLDALTRILEAEPFNAMIIFVRTKTATQELADKLSARGFAAAALNGDMSQQLREKTVEKLKQSRLDILVATDVAARGLDVERITHVINYDIPYDVETYIHRIGRTGRAGKNGDAILFIAPREQRLLHAIEKATRKKIDVLELPTTEYINDQRVARFMQKISDTLAAGELQEFQTLVDRFEVEHNVPSREIAAALAAMLQGDQSLFLTSPKNLAPSRRKENKPRGDRGEKSERFERGDKREKNWSKERQAGSDKCDKSVSTEKGPRARPLDRPTSPEGEVPSGQDRYRIEVGYVHGAKPNNIVGAIANEAGLDSKFIGRIQIFDDYSVVDLPQGMPSDIYHHLKSVWCGDRQLKLNLHTAGPFEGHHNKARDKKHHRSAFPQDKRNKHHTILDKKSGDERHKSKVRTRHKKN
jgi:ATP-dependent RNA helicase DeaD